MVEIIPPLAEIAEAVKKGKRKKLTLRKLLSLFGQQRRGSVVNQKLEATLSALDIRTLPDFRDLYLDEEVHFYTVATAEKEVATVREDKVEPDAHGYSVRRLITEERRAVGVVSLPPDATIREGFTLMLQWGYSQIPVLSSSREARGMFSWRSFGEAFAGGRKDIKQVRECMHEAHIVEERMPMSELIEQVQRHDAVLIRDQGKLFVTVFTAADLADQYRDMSESFVLLGEIEDNVRKLARRGKFSIAHLQACRHPDDDREVSRIEDLTFGSYVNLLGRPDNWDRLQVRLDRATFIAELEAVRKLRNAVMHFDPDGLTEDQVEQLKRFCKMLRGLV